MFQGLTDFGYRRTAVQAIGFYVVYTIIGLVALAALGTIAAFATGTQGFEAGMMLGLMIGPIFAVVYAAVLSFATVRAKGLLRSVGDLLIGLLGVALTGLVGLFVGMIVVAFLTTRPANPYIDATAHPSEPAAAH